MTTTARSMHTTMSNLYNFNLIALITVSGKNYEFYEVLRFTPKFDEVPRLLQVRCFRFCILLQVSHTTIVLFRCTRTPIWGKWHQGVLWRILEDFIWDDRLTPSCHISSDQNCHPKSHPIYCSSSPALSSSNTAA